MRCGRHVHVDGARVHGTRGGVPLSHVKLTMAEAEDAVRLAIESQHADFDAFPAVQRAQACMGAVAIVEALQVLGWRIIRPLKAIK